MIQKKNIKMLNKCLGGGLWFNFIDIAEVEGEEWLRSNQDSVFEHERRENVSSYPKLYPS